MHNRPTISDSTNPIEARGLTKSYEDGILAVDHVSFQVPAGKIFALLGGNGAGKTTTINLFLNLIEPTDGVTLIDGIDTCKEPLEAKKKVAFVSENVMLYPNFTAMQNLDYFARLGGRSDITRDELGDVLQRVGLPRRVHNGRLKDFSKGMRQKCGIAIAIVKNAPAILLDEPTSGLDPKAGFEFVQLLDQMRSEGRAILMSTHDIFRAREVADTFAIMDNGRVVMQEEASALAGRDLETLYMQYMGGHSPQPVG